MLDQTHVCQISSTIDRDTYLAKTESIHERIHSTNRGSQTLRSERNDTPRPRRTPRNRRLGYGTQLVQIKGNRWTYCRRNLEHEGLVKQHKRNLGYRWKGATV